MTEQDRRWSAVGAEVVSEYPLSQGQKALWFLQRLRPAGGTNNLAYAARIEHALDEAAYERAVYRLVERHPVMRTIFPEVNGEPLQRVFAIPQPSCFKLIDATEMSPGELKRQLSAAVFQRIDLDEAPPHRTLLFRLGEQRYIHLLLMHHILADMWSVAIYTHELGTLYRAEKLGEPDGLKPARSSYEEHIRQQEAMLAGARGAELWDYWREELAGELPVLGLIPDRPRPAVVTYRGAAESVRLDHRLTERLEAMAKERGIDPMALCLAVFQVLLHRHTGHDEILTGTPKACRSRRMAKVMGYFVNPVVVRTDLGGNPRFEDFVVSVAARVRGAMEHGEFPFSTIVERLGLTRDPSRTPLCQAVFAWQKTMKAVGEGINAFAINGDGGRVDFGELVYQSMRLDDRVAPYELTLQMSEVEGQLGATLEYNTDLYQATTIRRMLGHLTRLFEGVVEDPGQRILELPMLSQEERWQSIIGWNRTATGNTATEKTFQALFAEQARRIPEAEAVRCEGKSLSYGELEARSNQLARRLRSMGVGRETIVGLCLERSTDLILGIMAILKSDAAYLPLDPDYPAERLEFMVSDAQVPVLLTRESLAEMVPIGEATQVICIDRDKDLIDVESREPLVSSIEPGDLAYVIYTSGSTGKPKGALIEHRGLSNLITSFRKYVRNGEGKRVLQFSSICFDASVADMAMSLTSGATLVLAARERLASHEELHRLLRDERIKVVTLPPSMLRLVDPDGLDDLEVVISAGEPCTREIVQRWGRGRRRVLNAYGPTETTVIVTMEECSPTEAGDPTLGRALPNTELYVLDSSRQAVPIGTPGELYIGGAGVARGYLRRDELTMEKFIPNPFSSVAGARLYRSGDLVRYRDDGRLEYLGRIDKQVKLRGYRVELGEIETALRRHPAVSEAVAEIQELGEGDKRLVGYVVADRTAASPPELSARLRSWLRESLPEYMVPGSIVLLGELPMLPNGKIDRKRLPLPERAASVAVPPRTETERTIAAIWREVLGVEEVGIHENFFDAGGHSLLLSKAHARLRDVFMSELSMLDLFRHPTIGSLAAYLQGESSAGAGLEQSRERAALQRAALARQQRLRAPGGLDSGK